LGFFLAEGTCKGSCDRIEFTNQNIEYLKTCERTLNSLGIDCMWYSKPGRKDKCHFLRVKSPGLLINYFKEFYDNNDKTIPYFVYNFNKNSRFAFLKGFFDGDGSKSILKPMMLAQKEATIINGLIWITQDMFKNYSIASRENKFGKWFNLNLKEYSIKNEDAIKKITKGTTASYVYDVECDTHQFCAGIGNVLVHNCEHEDHCYRLKLEGFKTLWTDSITATYINDKPDEYKQMRNRLYSEYKEILKKKYKFDPMGSWLMYNAKLPKEDQI